VNPFSPSTQFTILAAALVLALAACRREPAAAVPAAVADTAPAAPVASAGAVPHGDHNPHHGGVVLMKGELHYEVVLDPSGRSHHVYFTDAVREELPASVASDVVLTLHCPPQADDRVAMRIDEAGESWVGSGQPVRSPQTATARLAFSIMNEPYWIDIPFGTARDTR
jgi:hypothetical protein